MIVALQPSFTILHTLTTTRAPSPIVNLSWHASSTKQKSDMLATQTLDGDLRVWSVSKPPTADSPKVIRVLKRGDNVEPGLNWIAWSKNGRILQYSEGSVPIPSALPPPTLLQITYSIAGRHGPGTSAPNMLPTNLFQRSRELGLLRITDQQQPFSLWDPIIQFSSMISVHQRW